MTSYFEIDGEIIACDTIGDPLDVSATPQSSLDAAMRLHEREQIAAELTGDPNSLYYEDADLADVLNEPDLKQFSKFQMIGRGMAGAGAAILMTPDPLPLVDELVLAGVALHATTW
ncbi:MAG: hypothetical protein [Cressdnaviricota sp.]|nr:MAG: hypothetical protein [Cressdnaviricota sp.]